jgi:hypothetical protein
VQRNYDILFNSAARSRTAASLRLSCSAIFEACVPDKGKALRRPSSYGVQTGPAGFIPLAPFSFGQALRFPAWAALHNRVYAHTRPEICAKIQPPLDPGAAWRLHNLPWGRPHRNLHRCRGSARRLGSSRTGAWPFVPRSPVVLAKGTTPDGSPFVVIQSGEAALWRRHCDFGVTNLLGQCA